jgi:hypothetical protein
VVHRVNEGYATLYVGIEYPGAAVIAGKEIPYSEVGVILPQILVFHTRGNTVSLKSPVTRLAAALTGPRGCHDWALQVFSWFELALAKQSAVPTMLNLRCIQNELNAGRDCMAQGLLSGAARLWLFPLGARSLFKAR